MVDKIQEQKERKKLYQKFYWQRPEVKKRSRARQKLYDRQPKNKLRKIARLIAKETGQTTDEVMENLNRKALMT